MRTVPTGPEEGAYRDRIEGACMGLFDKYKNAEQVQHNLPDLTKKTCVFLLPSMSSFVDTSKQKTWKRSRTVSSIWHRSTALELV